MILFLGEWPIDDGFHRVTMVQGRRSALLEGEGPVVLPADLRDAAAGTAVRARGRVVALRTSAEPRGGRPVAWWALEAWVGASGDKGAGVVVESGHDFLLIDGFAGQVKVIAEGGHLAGLACCDAGVSAIAEPTVFRRRRSSRPPWGASGPPAWLPDDDRRIVEVIADGRAVGVDCQSVAGGDTVEVEGILDRVVDPTGTPRYPGREPIATVVRSAVVRRTAPAPWGPAGGGW
jgi:hypothetical protein